MPFGFQLQIILDVTHSPCAFHISVELARAQTASIFASVVYLPFGVYDIHHWCSAPDLGVYKYIVIEFLQNNFVIEFLQANTTATSSIDTQLHPASDIQHRHPATSSHIHNAPIQAIQNTGFRQRIIRTKYKIIVCRFQHYQI